MIRRLICILLPAVLLTGCYTFRPSLLLRTPRNFVYDSLPKIPISEFKISANDLLEFRMYSNDGFKLIDMTTLSGTGNINQVTQSFVYLIEYDGTVKLPVIGRLSLNGMSLREAELHLEEKYSTYYNKPFILLKVMNKRVMVFPGNEGTARVIPLTNENVTLIEALALAGGLYSDGKAKKIKLIRGDPKNPLVYLIDLSTINGMRNGDVVIQPNDIIYVESRPRVASRIISETAPYISLITSFILLYTLIKKTP